MKFLKIFLLIILSLFLFLYSLVFMVGLSLERTLLNIDHYRNFTQEHEIFETLHDTLGESMFDGDEGEFLSDMFDAEWLEDTFFLVFEDLLAYTAGEKDSLTATVDLSHLETAMKDEFADEIMEMEGVDRAEAERIVEEELESEDDFMTHFSLDEELDEDLKGALGAVAGIRQYFPIFSYALLGFILLLMCLLATLKGGLKWYGLVTFIAGLLVSISLFGISISLTPTLIRNFVDIPPGLDFVNAFLKDTFDAMLVIPLAYGGVGLLLLILGVILGRLGKKGTPSEVEETDTTEELEE